MKTEFYIHGHNGAPKVAKAEPGEVLIDVLARHGYGTDEELIVFVGECNDALVAIEHVEDRHEPVDMRLTIAELEIEKNSHVHCHVHRRIDTTVNFGGSVLKHRFSPQPRSTP